MSNEFAKDESAREEPGYGDPKLSEGDIVEDQLAALAGLPRIAEPEPVVEKDEQVKEEQEEALLEKDEEISQRGQVDEDDEESEEEGAEEGEAEEGEEDEGLSPVEQQLADALEQNRQLMAMFTQQSQLLPGAVPALPVVPAQPVPGLAQPQAPQLTAEQHEELIADPAKFNEYIGNVFQIAQQSALSNLPAVTEQIVNTRMMVNKFFESNPDLQPMARHVQDIAVSFERAIPGLSPEQAMTQAAAQVRQQLGRPAPAQVKAKAKPGLKKGKGKKQRFAGSPKRRAGTPRGVRSKDGVKLTDTQVQLAEMAQAAGNMLDV